MTECCDASAPALRRVFHAHAKINLYLDVLRRRPDGYHDIETLFQSISLRDELHVEPAEHLTLTCSNPTLGTGTGNLILRAASWLQEETRTRFGARIHLLKNIPIAAGLAGGSSNAAAALVALNQLWQLNLSPSRLLEGAAILGSDVPFCLQGGTAAAVGRGEILHPLPPLPETWLILIHPPLHVSTPSVYNDPSLRHSPEVPIGGYTPTFRRALETAHSGSLHAMLFNRMQEVVFTQHPKLVALRDRLLHAGCNAALMSGSGPTIFGLCASADHGKLVQEQLPGLRTTLAHTVGTGVHAVGA